MDPFHIHRTEAQKTVSSEDSSPFLPFLSQLVDDIGLEYYRRQRREPQLIFWAQSVNCFQVLSSSFEKQNQKKPYTQTLTSLKLLNSILASFSIQEEETIKNTDAFTVLFPQLSCRCCHFNFIFFKEVTSSLKQSTNKPPLTLSSNTLVANYSHYFQCNWDFSKPSFFPQRPLSKQQRTSRRVPAPVPKTSSSGTHLGQTRMGKRLQIGPWSIQVSRRKCQT